MSLITVEMVRAQIREVKTLAAWDDLVGRVFYQGVCCRVCALVLTIEAIRTRRQILERLREEGGKRYA